MELDTFVTADIFVILFVRETSLLLLNNYILPFLCDMLYKSKAFIY